MKSIFKKTRDNKGRRRLYLFGLKVASYRKKPSIQHTLLSETAVIKRNLRELSELDAKKSAQIDTLNGELAAIKRDFTAKQDLLLAEISKRTPKKPNELIFYWDEAWADYLKQNDLASLTANMKRGMDKYSIEHIDTFLSLINLLPHKANISLNDGYGWTSKDAEYLAQAQKYSTSRKLNESEIFMFANRYGLADIYDQVKERVSSKAVIDAGAFNGNTALLFHEMFEHAKIYSFEPMQKTFALLQNTIEDNKLSEVVFPVKKGLGHEEAQLEIHYNNETSAGATLNASDASMSDTVDVTTIDRFSEKHGLEIGFIKLDIEGFEKKALEGAKESITRDKPIIVAALYHNPVDFFEIKDYLSSLNSDYKYMIRRSERVIPLGDIVLIAY